MNTLIPGAPLRSLSPTSNEYQRAEGVSRAAKPARVARFTLDAPEHSGTIPGARGDILTPGVALTSNLAVIFTLNPHTQGGQRFAPGRATTPLTDEKEFRQWLLKETGGAKSTPTAVSGGCPTISQMLHMFRKFVHVDGQARRDWLEERALTRGKQYANAPHYEKCVKTTIEFDYLDVIHHGRIRRPQGSKYGEIVTFVKGGDISEGLRSLLESLCQVPGCRHVRM